MAIRRNREVEWLALAFEGIRATAKPGAELSKLGHHAHKIFAQKRFAAGQSHFFDAERNEHPDHSQVLFDRQLGELRAVSACAAVDTTVIAAVRDRYPQVGDGASEFIPQTRMGARRRDGELLLAGVSKETAEFSVIADICSQPQFPVNLAMNTDTAILSMSLVEKRWVGKPDFPLRGAVRCANSSSNTASCRFQ